MIMNKTTIVINPQQIQFADFVQAIHRRFDKEGTVIFKNRNEIRVFEVNGISINVKRFHTPYLINRIIYTFLSRSKAKRSYQFALQLRDMGIDTPEPVAYICIKRGGLLDESYYISRQADYPRNMYEFGQGGIIGREHILEAFATLTASLHEKGIFHKDYSPGNILFKEENGAVSFCLVDINRMRFGPVSIRQGCANFARLWGQRPFFELVVRKYAEIRQADSTLCIQQALQARCKFWKRYTRKHPVPFLPLDI